MSFITTDDLLTAIHKEQLDAITGEDDALPQFGMDAAEEEMKGYMNPKYDTAKIFVKTGAARNKMLILLGRDMAIYHILTLCNPGVDYQSKKDRYDRAVEWFKQLQKEQINPPGLEKKVTDTTNSEILMSSNDKRTQHY